MSVLGCFPATQHPAQCNAPLQWQRTHNVNKRGLHGQAAGAANVHEEAVGRLYQPFQLVLALLSGGGRVQQVSRLEMHNSAGQQPQ